MPPIARLLDANANRAREALRVMEDAARFVLDEPSLTNELKSIRHDLRAALDQLSAGWLEANRDVSGDVGMHISTSDEMCRETFADVVIAAGKRLSEALRAIEEVSKTVNPALASEAEKLRYRAYAAEAALHLRLGSGRPRQWKLCLLLTEVMCKHHWRDVLCAAIEGGVDCVQVREKDMDGGQLACRVREVIRIARPDGASVIVNDRVDVALACGADGVHLGTDDMTIADARRLAGRSLIIGASTHDLDEARAAVAAGADYCGVGSMFPSPLKPDRSPSGIAYLREFLERFPEMPHLVIGGITAENAEEVTTAGARGIAVCSAICAADDPCKAARRLRPAAQIAGV